MNVTETIYHGLYRSTRTAEVEPTRSSLRVYLLASDYPAWDIPDGRIDELLTSLTKTGQADHGWSHFEVSNKPTV